MDRRSQQDPQPQAAPRPDACGRTPHRPLALVRRVPGRHARDVPYDLGAAPPLADLLTSTTLGPWPIPDGVCGSITHPLDPDDYLPCPHPRGHDFPCNDDPNFDAAAWRQRVDAEQAAEEARRAALTPEQRDEEDEQARQWEYEEMRAEQASEYVDDKYYGDED
ncbi:hypothetical protein ACFQ0X_44130 [Streptomyces rectiviolaceus]|uniref:hypothetical protein n=1 Tax=Streptomyces rectiviolaceus TaxID=332591 RepID=UPI00363D2FF8